MRYAIGVVPVGVNLRALPLRGVLGVVPVGVLVDSAKKVTFLKYCTIVIVTRFCVSVTKQSTIKMHHLVHLLQNLVHVCLNCQTQPIHLY